MYDECLLLPLLKIPCSGDDEDVDGEYYLHDEITCPVFRPEVASITSSSVPISAGTLRTFPSHLL